MNKEKLVAVVAERDRIRQEHPILWKLFCRDADRRITALQQRFLR